MKKRTNIYDSIKKRVAGSQMHKCANKPGSNLIEGYECTLFQIPNREGSFGLEGYEIDHIIEVASGGSDDVSNLQALCPACHRVKTKLYLTNKREKTEEKEIEKKEERRRKKIEEKEEKKRRKREEKERQEEKKRKEKEDKRKEKEDKREEKERQEEKKIEKESKENQEKNIIKNFFELQLKDKCKNNLIVTGKELYTSFKSYCFENNIYTEQFFPISHTYFYKQLESNKIVEGYKRTSKGKQFYFKGNTIIKPEEKTDEYIGENDPVKLWLQINYYVGEIDNTEGKKEKIPIKDDKNRNINKISMKDLKKRYKDDEKDEFMYDIRFKDLLVNNGCVLKKIGNVNYIVGIIEKTDDEKKAKRKELGLEL